MMIPTDKQTRLTKTLRDAWVKALRSGDFIQGTGTLHRNGAYCCFGVLLRVAGYTDADIGERITIGTWNQTLEEDLCSPGVCAGEENRVRLEGMNDGHHFPKASFAEIADWIEKNIPGVEV